MFITMTGLGNVVEPKPVLAGRYELTISEAKLNQPKSADKGANIEVSLGIGNNPTAPNVRHFISLPKADDKEETKHFKQLMLKRFLSQFSIGYTEDGFNIEDFLGATASAELTLSEPDDTGNIYNRLKLDRVE